MTGATGRRLVLIRHAEAADGPVDLGRPLTLRGHADARALGARLHAEGIVPDHVVTSPARRAVETWDDAATHVPASPQPVIDDRIYANNIAGLLAVVHDTPDTVTVLVLVGHNPGLTVFGYAIRDVASDSGVSRVLARGLPPAAAAIYAVHVPWSGLELGTAALIQLISAPDA